MSDINVQTFSGKVKVSNDLTVTTNVHADYFKGDGSLLTNLPSGSGGVWNTNSDNEIYFISSNVGISNADPGHNLSVGSNLYVDDDGSNVLVVTGNVKADYFVGDGSLLTGLSGSGGVWSTNGDGEIYFINSNVGISNADPGHELSVGSNLYVDDDGSNVLVVTGNVKADYFVGNGSLLTNLPSGSGGVWSTNAEGEIYFINSNVGISNADPGHELSVGSNLYVDDDGSNVLVIDGNLTAESMTLGGIGIVPSYPLSSVTETGNTTPHTIEFTNAETGLVVSSNIVVTGNVTAGYLYGDASNVTGIASNLHQTVENGNVTSNTVQFSNATTGLVTTANVEVGGELTVSGNVTVDTDTLFVDSVNDRVGVGTTSPLETLDVYGGFLMRPERTTTTYSSAWNRSDGNFYFNNTPQSGSDIDVIYSKNAIYTTTGGLKVSPPSNDSEFYYIMQPDMFTPGLYYPLPVSITSPYLSGDVFSSTRFKADNTEDFTGFAVGQDYVAGDTLNDFSQNLDIARAHSAHMYFKTASPDGSLTEKMRITNAGNVGIGTTSPNATLHIKNETESSGTGDVYIPGMIKKPTECLRLQNKWHNTGSGALLRFTNQHPQGTNPSTGEYNLAGIAGYDHDGSWGGGLAFYTSPGSGTGGDDLTLRMSIDSTGAVNIPGPTTGAAHGSASMLYLLDTCFFKEWSYANYVAPTVKVTFNTSTEIPDGAKAVLAEVYLSRDDLTNGDHQIHVLGKNHLGNQTNWRSGAGQPSTAFSADVDVRQTVELLMPGETDGFTHYYGKWHSSVIIPIENNQIYYSNRGNSSSTGWVYMRVRGYYI